MNYSDDLIIEHAGTVLYFKFLEWDTRFFGKPSYVLDIGKSILLPNDAIKLLVLDKLRDCFITVKLDTQMDYTIHAFLQECGFRYIDTEVVLEYRSSPFQVQDNPQINIEKTVANSNLPYRELGSAFNLTRFHCDIHIPTHQADELWIQYLQNFTPDENRHMFVAKFSDNVAGAILVNVTEDVAYLFFVSVLEKYHSLGIGTRLIQEVIKHFQGYTIRTGTQVKNISAMNFYLKNGFSKILQTSTVMHYWS